VGKPGPTVLFAEAAHLHRLMTEGGLRPSFLGVFRGRTVFETVGDAPHAGGMALDVLLREFPLVAIDERLLLPPDPTAPDASEAVKYRDNFLRKIATRRQVRLIVLEGDEGAQVEAVERLGKPPADDQASPGWRAADVVVVMTTRMVPAVRTAIETLRSSQAVARIYLMNDRLQTGRDGLHLALADHVWPICVARLLAVRACMAPAQQRAHNEPAQIVAWRTFAWGVTSIAESDWEDQYILALRELLLPSRDGGPDDVVAERNRQTMIILGASPSAHVTVPPYGWHDPSDILESQARSAIDDTALDGLLQMHATPSRDEQDQAAGMLTTNVHADWSTIAAEQGLVHLRRLADGRLWPVVDVSGRSDRQQDGWRRLSEQGMRLLESRDHHLAAIEELTVARSRYLPFSWRLIIAAATTCFVLQFLLATLLPLRPPSSSLPFTGPSFMGLPVAGDSVGFLIDRSSSMAGKRLDTVKSDLQRAINALPSDARFAAVAFSSNMSLMPGADTGLVAATDDAKIATTQWLNSLEADGDTIAGPALKEMLAWEPTSIILLTDGEFSDPDAVREAVDEAARKGKTTINTVALYGREGEDSLRTIASMTNGTYRFVAYDPFSPPGFDILIALVVAAALTGAALGLLLPWLLELRAGLRATRTLRLSQGRLLHLLAAQASAADSHARNAAAVALGRRSNAAASLQRSLARRAMLAVDDAISRVSVDRREPWRAASAARGLKLVAEDRADLAAALDEPLPGAGDAGELGRSIQELAAEHAKKLGKEWGDLCDRHDQAKTGHIPLNAIDDEFYGAARRLFDAASSRGHGLMSRQDGGTTPLTVFADSLAERLLDDSHRPFMSVPVEARDGKMPGRIFAWVGIDIESHDGGSISGWLRDHVNHRVKIPHWNDVDNLGITALALIQEEIPLSIEAGPGDTPRFVAVKTGG